MCKYIYTYTIYLQRLDWQPPWCNKTRNRAIHAYAQIRKFHQTTAYHLIMNKYRDLTRTFKMCAERIESKTR